jgi:hypothetical protein
MVPCVPQIFTGITQDKFDALVKKSNEYNLAINGPSGQVHYHGVTVAWKYEPTVGTGTLSLQVLEKHFYESCELINSKLKDLVDAASASVAAQTQATTPKPTLVK